MSEHQAVLPGRPARVWRTGSAALLLALLAGTAAAKDLAELVADLGNPDYQVRLAAQQELMSRKDPAVLRPLLEALPRLDSLGRSYAQTVLDALPAERTRPALRSLLRSDDAELRALAAASLHRQGEPDGIAVVARDVRDVAMPPAVALRVLSRLLSIRHPVLAAAVRERLAAPADKQVRISLLRLVNYGYDAGAVPVLRGLSAEDDAEIRLLARGLLFRFGQTDVLPALAADLAEPSVPYVTLSDVLNWLRAGPAPPDQLAAALLARLEKENQPTVLRLILQTLADWRYRPALAAAERLVDDPDATIARAAFALVAKLGGKGQIESFRRGLAGKDATIRVLSAEALRRYDDLTGLPAVVEASRGDDVEARREAARALGGFRERTVLPALLDALEDADLSVRSQAWSSLVQTATALFPYRRFDWNGLGYLASGAPGSRAKAVERLRAWWASVGG